MPNSCVLVCGNIKDSTLDERTLELVGAGKELADKLDVELAVAFLGDEIDGVAEEMSFFGVDKVYKLAHPSLGSVSPELWVKALQDLCKEIDPKIVLMLHLSTWLDIGTRLAFRFDSILTSDCVDLKIDSKDGLLLRTKPVYGGSALAVLKYEGFPQFVTVRSHVLNAAERQAVKGSVVDMPVDIDTSTVKVKSVKTVKEEALALDKANVIVAGGRGIGGPEGFEELESLAQSFRQSFDEVMVGCSRPAVDSGWMTSNHQVGLSGAMVQPDLYIAVGISGAIQHLVGMARSRKIVAVNTDANSSIFSVADYGVVDDYKKIIPALKTTWEELGREKA